MPDFLAYRIPNKQAVKKVGLFKLINKLDGLNKEFIFSNFNQNKQYKFTSEDIDFDSTYQTHYATEEPKVISKQQYLKYGNRILGFFRSKSLNKIVFSRIKMTEFDSRNTKDLFEKLCMQYPKAFVYLISSKAEGTWIGATPETLIQSFENSGFTMALAGTKEKNTKVLWNDKEYKEQKWVSDYVLETLKSNGIQNIENQGPYESEAGNIMHLRTDFSFDLQDINTLDLARKLHPTPAVSGLPKAESISLINQIEGHELGYSRDFYTGFLGIIGDKNSQLYVNLRCCQIFNNKAFLYIGGGYTEDSDPEKEWDETERKSETLLNIIEKL